MKLRKPLLPLLFFISIFLFVSIACSSSTPDPDAPTSTPRPTDVPKVNVSLKVINETQSSLCYLLVAPSDEEFKKEYLNGETIDPGESHTFSGFEVGEYNVKVHNCDKNMVNALYYVDMDQELMTWTIVDATLQIVNESSQSMCEIYVSPSSAPESAWGPSQLDREDGEVLEQGMYIDFSLAKGKWDIRLVPCDESVDSITEIGLKVEGELTYTITDKE